MFHGHQACANKANAVAAQQIEGQGSQQGQHLNTVALAAALGVLAELCVTRASATRFRFPTPTHQTQQCVWAGAQGGEQIVDLAEGIANA